MTSGLLSGGAEHPGPPNCRDSNLSIGTNPQCDIPIDITREPPLGCAHVRDWRKLAH